MTALSIVLVAALGYLIGGVPTAYLAGRLRGVDIRTRGSGNVGGTNALRVLGWKVGLPVMAVDLAKGYLAAWLLPKIPLSGLDPVYLAIAGGVGAVLGHIFSPYLGLRGGKGVAAGAGMLLALVPIPVGICAGVFFLVALGTGIVSLGSLSAACALPLATWFLPAHPAVRWLTVALAVLIFWTHRSNIQRLIQGRENRFRRPWER
ncbi:MAG: Glycerol-3-phosphate acyltransferase [Acetothermia bacterium 64_32]|nr:MAG: Glycerol-3-phosphate acyltransferase [Acetothermia bacterium 64_32]HAF70954.1 acyl-phosphate glycerol 3-phosphate acyltransferase [Candidatus Acetothermia bacterium]